MFITLKSDRKNLVSTLLYLTFIFFFLSVSFYSSGQKICISSGNWITAGWSPSPPVAGDSVVVNSGCTLTVDASTPAIGSLTIFGSILITNSATSVLSMSGNLNLFGSAVLENRGRLDFKTANKEFNLNDSSTYLHIPFSNSAVDESVFILGRENFSIKSNLIIRKWMDTEIPLGDPSRVQFSSFGNLTLGVTGTWNQDGYFALPLNNRIRGKLTISEGTVVMDDGTGNTTTLILDDVETNGTGNIVFQRGSSRNLNLTTGDFTIASASPAKPTTILDTSFGVLNWNITGNMQIGHDFRGVFGSNFQPGSDLRINVAGNLSITGGEVVFVCKADAPLRLTVSGNTSLNNSSGKVTFIEGANGNLNFTTNNLVISGGFSNYLNGTPSSLQYAKGISIYNVLNDFIIDGPSNSTLAYSDTNGNRTRVLIGRDFIMNASNATLTGAYTGGQFAFRTGRNFTILNGQFKGQDYPMNIATDTIFIGADFTFNSSNPKDFIKLNRGHGLTSFYCNSNFMLINSGLGYGQGFVGVDSSAAPLDFRLLGSYIQNGGQFTGILSGSGNLTMNISGTLDLNSGVFRGCSNTIYSNASTATLTTTSIDFDGGLFSLYYSCNNTNATATVTINGPCKISFSSTTDDFTFIGLTRIGTDESNMSLSLTVTGLFSILGANGRFVSSLSGAASTETVSLANVSISNGRNSFNSEQASVFQNGHNVTLNISGNLEITGGTTFLSAKTQSINATVFGNFTQSGGNFSLKGGDVTGTGNLNVRGTFNLSNGNFFLHNSLTDTLNTGATISMTINSDNDATGDFIHTGGTIWFDNCATTPVSLSLSIIIRSPNYQLGSSGAMILANPSSINVFGMITFSRAGTISFNRSNGHSIQNIRQTISTGCTLDVVSGDIQIASGMSNPALPDFLLVQGTLNLRLNRVVSNAVNKFSGVMVTGRVRTQHPQGLYNGTMNAAFATNVADSLDFFLNTTSVVEYNGTDNQIITGTGIAKARSNQHRYGILEINFTGTPDIEFVYPTNIPNDSAVRIATSLILTAGELNLDNDHDPSNGGGRMISLENTTTTLTRTGGYIRSETEDGSGLVKWNVGNNSSARTFHFGYNSTNYIPFTYTNNSGSTGLLYCGTYHTNSSNTPLPPGVTHLRDNYGNNNSLNTVDRFWYLRSSSTSGNAKLEFTAAASETVGMTNFLAQRWNQINLGWTNPAPGIQNQLTNGVSANVVPEINNWWTLTGNSSPLPVDLVSFSASCQGNAVELKWTTASEVNNDYFVISRSYDGIYFEEIARVNGSGNSTGILSYTHLDKSPTEQPLIYYRLKQTDFDGSSKDYEPIVTKNCNSTGKMTVNVINSVGNNPAIVVNSPVFSKCELVIMNSSGATIYQSEILISKGVQVIPLKTIEQAGLLIFQLRDKENAIGGKFIVSGN